MVGIPQPLVPLVVDLDEGISLDKAKMRGFF